MKNNYDINKEEKTVAIYHFRWLKFFEHHPILAQPDCLYQRATTEQNNGVQNHQGFLARLWANKAMGKNFHTGTPRL